jgi:hypothetical protein
MQIKSKYKFVKGLKFYAKTTSDYFEVKSKAKRRKETLLS